MVGIYEYALHLLPYGDVLSMEDEESFKNIFVVRRTHARTNAPRTHTCTLTYTLICVCCPQENDTSSLYFVVRSLMQLQRTYGTITNIKGTVVLPLSLKSQPYCWNSRNALLVRSWVACANGGRPSAQVHTRRG